MSDYEINKAIAEHRGWKFEELDEEWIPPKGCELIYPPEYTTDLNAMHSVEESHILPHLWVNYEREMRMIYLTKYSGTPRHVWHYPARLRAEAFCRTVGIWED